MASFVTVIHVLTCIFIVIFVLVQSGKGAEISASFGGSSQTVFGSSGGANFFVKLTGVLAVIFFATSIILTVMGSQNRKSLFESMEGNTPVTAPTTPAKAPAAPQVPPAPPAAKH